jgi:hypothetical protein
MKSRAVMWSLAISAIALSSEFTTASATKMDGKCCQSSDTGRSWRYRMAMLRAANPHPGTCSAHADLCIRWSTDRAYSLQACMTAKAQCVQTGVYVGPYSRWEFTGVQRM